MPAVKAVNGCVGVSLMVDRKTGRCIFTSAWETEDALRAGLTLVQPYERASEMFGGKPKPPRSGRSRCSIGTISPGQVPRCCARRG